MGLFTYRQNRVVVVRTEGFSENLCSGQWTLTFSGISVKSFLPHRIEVVHVTSTVARNYSSLPTSSGIVKLVYIGFTLEMHQHHQLPLSPSHAELWVKTQPPNPFNQININFTVTKVDVGKTQEPIRLPQSLILNHYSFLLKMICIKDREYIGNIKEKSSEWRVVKSYFCRWFFFLKKEKGPTIKSLVILFLKKKKETN